MRYAYDGDGHLAAVTGPDGAVTSVDCDALGLPVSVTGPDGAVTRYERDEFGRAVRVTGPDGSQTATEWTLEGRPLSRAFPDGSAESWDWDAEGNLLRHVSPGGAASAYEYGPFDKVMSVTASDGTRTVFGYDAELRVTSVEHAGLTWSYARDEAGRVTAETDYNGALTRYELDAAGQMTRRVNAAGQPVSYSYDTLGNVVTRTAGDNVTTFTYDPAGDLVRAASAAADVIFGRDALGRVLSESCDGRAVWTSYDAAGRVAERVTPSGSVSAWSYGASGLPVSLSSDGRPLRFGHDAHGRETSRELPGGIHLAQDWDPLGRLTGQVLTGPGPGSPTTMQQRRYSYNADGYVTGVSDLMAGTRAFGLDPAGRVTEVSGTGWAERYTYDPLGNITSSSWPSAPQGAHEVSGTLTRQARNIRYRHDAAGRVIQRSKKRVSRKPDTWRYEWDADNRLVASTMPDGSTWRYAYDALGRRVRKRHLSPDGEILAETLFAWHGLTLAEQVVLAPGEPGRETVTTWDYQPGSFAPLTQATRTSLREAPQDVIDAEFHAIVTDLTGTPAELVGTDGALSGHQRHTLWGTAYWDPGGASTPLRFPGQYADEETGLHYNNQRYYDPVSGAYLSPDPLGLAPAPNPHAYVPNPHVLVDPLGLMADDSYTGLHRGMRGTDDGSPQLGQSASTLGARPNIDIPVDDNGMVRPGNGGMSVNTSPTGMPAFRRPSTFGGTGKNLNMYRIGSNQLGPGLRYVPDPASSGHGFLEPAYEMPFDDYQGHLHSIQGSWSEVVP